MKEIIHLDNIVKSYRMGENALTVLKGISLTVEEGEFLAILGPSGSGKSILMNIVGCMDHFDSGTYLLDGTSVGDCSDDELTHIRNQKIGFIFQKYQLIPQYTVLQNVMMPLLVRGMSSRQAEEVCLPTIEMLGLTERLSHKPRQLSGGQQQRVSIARALVGKPSLLLADEPTGALDSSTGREVLALFQRLNDMGNTILMITHDLNVAKQARQVVRIVDGELFYD